MVNAFVALRALVDAITDKEGLAAKTTGPLYSDRLKGALGQAREVLLGPAINISNIKVDAIRAARQDLNEYLDARFSGDHLASFKTESLSILLTEYEPQVVSEYLKKQWRELRNDNTMPRLTLLEVIRGFHAVGLLTEEQHELWCLRTRTCPGHDDEGGRSWCAYCGDMPKEKT